MKRTVSIKLAPTPEQAEALQALQAAFAEACQAIVPSVVAQRCWNRVALHHLVYYPIRAESPLGSQMVCQAIRTVCDAYRALQIKQSDPVPVITLRHTSSVHFDKRTYRLASQTLSLYTLTGRIVVALNPGAFQLD